jgi:hypothetical protein
MVAAFSSLSAAHLVGDKNFSVFTFGGIWICPIVWNGGWIVGFGTMVPAPAAHQARKCGLILTTKTIGVLRIRKWLLFARSVSSRSNALDFLIPECD